jgi:hypothetical protein
LFREKLCDIIYTIVIFRRKQKWRIFMNFVEGKCPECSGALQIPEDRETIICMYCGKEIAVNRAKAALQNESVNNHVVYDKYFEAAMKGLPRLIPSIENGMKSFKKATYERVFKEYYEANKESLDAAEQAYLITAAKEEFLKEASRAILLESIYEINNIAKNRIKEQRIMDYNMVLVVYLIPAILEHKGEVSHPLADTILEEWKNEFPKTNLQKATFESIVGGFRRKLCYITTAVCENSGRPDDCYELNLLRNYRDEYLMQEEDSELVQEYYNIAPTIVKRINKQKDSSAIYDGIWKDYIQPCIRLIEQNQQDECKELYTKMVKELQKDYVLS